MRMRAGQRSQPQEQKPRARQCVPKPPQFSPSCGYWRCKDELLPGGGNEEAWKTGPTVLNCSFVWLA